MLAFGMPNMSEWLVILVIILIFFGAGRLPDVLKQFGKGVREFKDASEGLKSKRTDDEDEVYAERKPPKAEAKRLASAEGDTDGDNDDAGAVPVRKQDARNE